MTALNSNLVRFCGEMASSPVYSHDIFAERFYTFKLKVERLSGQYDYLPVTVSERLLYDLPSDRVLVDGQLRSYNIQENGKSKLVLQVFARDITSAPTGMPDENCVQLQGYVCKPPVYRVTPFSREIADILLAVNRSYGKSDYLPCICWGRNARFCRTVGVSQFLKISGRLQSRIYHKKTEDGSTAERTAYEVSVQKLSNREDGVMTV